MKKALARVPAPRSARAPLTLRVRLVSALALLGLVAGLGLFAARPAHTAGGPIAVSVTNTPLPTSPTDVAAPAQPFSKRLDLSFASGFASQSFTVPAGKRLILTYVSSDCGVAPGAKALLDLATTFNGQEVESHLPLIPQGNFFGQDTFASSDPVTIYADAGTTVTVAALDSNTSGSGGLIVGLYGYYVNVP